ncbi:tRNA preQ1(34) S-adenosylmethionine ribosyltransferase-isomerase QueA [Candidatus Saccharibacteria bacterium]|nr:tRNA preQ1(34) S-adenosylmethionine ribosyltransferase-isomerase QueA [Candidatus Saccharibacteria bacterium]
MKISEYNYDLPENLIANHPPEIRGQSRLLVLDRQTGEIKDRKYADLANLLNPSDLIILNDTKVIKSRLFPIKKSSGSRREIIILEHHADTDWHRHKILYRGRLKTSDILVLDQHELAVDDILGDGLAIVSSKTNLLQLADEFGTVPLPLYMNRDADETDIDRYQTVFADNNKQGSAAAPTASLNMTDDLLARLREKGVQIKYLTLHVGLGTFLPIRTDRVEDHEMHSEHYNVPTDTLTAIDSTKKSGGKVIALGTTVCRTLEHFANTKEPFGEADIFIYPGHKFQIVDALLTNFHTPRSTVLMLAAAFATWPHLKSAYDHAIAEQYQFLSYGDSMLIK